MKTFVALFALLAVAAANPLPLVQIIVNVDAPAVDASPVAVPAKPEIEPTPVHIVDEAESIIPDPVVLPAPVLPDVEIPAPVVMPEPSLPEVEIPAPVVMPEPSLPEVEIPAPVVMPEPAVPEVVDPVVALPEELN